MASNILYYSMFYSRFTYCLRVSGTTYSQNSRQLIFSQKRVFRYFENYRCSLQDLRMHTLFIKHTMLKPNQIYYCTLLQHIKTVYLKIILIKISILPTRNSKIYNYLWQTEFDLPGSSIIKSPKFT